ncbi:MAG: hypothetical protein KC636_08610, partial [Myxococcales bacterium]|nr:hypothetical protein [Myxococcales bacterium]
TQHGELVDGTPIVWTNTGPDGMRSADPQACDDWTSSDFMDLGRIGASPYTDSRWTNDSDIVNPTICSDLAHVYCFEQE